jgi:hypothetical protein
MNSCTCRGALPPRHKSVHRTAVGPWLLTAGAKRPTHDRQAGQGRAGQGSVFCQSHVPLEIGGLRGLAHHIANLEIVALPTL